MTWSLYTRWPCWWGGWCYGPRFFAETMPLLCLLAAFGFAGASLAQTDPLVLVALTLAMVGIVSAYGPFWSLPSSFLGGSAAAGGIALVNTIASLGGFVGPSLIGVLKEQTGSYASAMAMLAVVFVVAAFIVLALGRAMAARAAMLRAKAGAGA